MRDSFIGRVEELALLDELNQSDKGEMLVMYGRRRVGKSRLISHWIKTRQQKAFYWIATQSNSTHLLRNFSQKFYKFLYPHKTLPQDFTYSYWDAAFDAVAEYAQQHRLIFILDEFTYLADAAPEVPSILQNTWDQYLQWSSFVMLSGSHVHMMMKAVHSYHAPLYGRASRRIHLKPFDYGSVAQFFPKYQPDELVATYAVLGGVPAYLNLFNPAHNFSENLRQVVLKPFSPMQSDALLLLHEQFDEPMTYSAILQAIANNKRTNKEISDFTEYPATHINRYIATLLELGLIERRVPVTDMNKPVSRKGRYYLKDAYLRFYFRFIEPHLENLEMGQRSKVLADINQHIRAFIGEYTFEALCRDWVGVVSDQRKLPLLIDTVGEYWGSDAQMDVMATEHSTKKVLLGECKWGLQPVEVEVIEKLARQAPKVVSHLPDSAKWKPYLYLFTRTELTPEAAARAKELQVEIISLERLDHDLRQEV